MKTYNQARGSGALVKPPHFTLHRCRPVSAAVWGPWARRVVAGAWHFRIKSTSPNDQKDRGRRRRGGEEEQDPKDQMLSAKIKLDPTEDV